VKERQFRELLRESTAADSQFTFLLKDASLGAYVKAAISVTVLPIYVFSLLVAGLLTLSNW
jgi:hypothetical protein